MAISFPLGYIAEVNKDKAKGQIIMTGALVAIAMPQFWTALLMLIVFGLKLTSADQPTTAFDKTIQD